MNATDAIKSKRTEMKLSDLQNKVRTDFKNLTVDEFFFVDTIIANMYRQKDLIFSDTIYIDLKNPK